MIYMSVVLLIDGVNLNTMRTIEFPSGKIVILVSIFVFLSILTVSNSRTNGNLINHFNKEPLIYLKHILD